MKKLPVLLLSSMMLMGIVSCGGNSSSTSSTTDNPSSVDSTTPSSVDTVTVESVKIDEGYSTKVLDTSTTRLSATVKGSKSGLKVSWSSSDESIAKVTNGVVKFAKVEGTKEVTITATSRDDSSKSDSVTFTVVHSVIDLSVSKGNPDASLFLSDDPEYAGSLIVSEPGDTALVYADVYDTKWYVQADFKITEFDETDQYPKFGIMQGTEQGSWNTSTETHTVKNTFFYVDSQLAYKSTGWTSFNMVGQNDVNSDWNWGAQKGGFNAKTKVSMNEYYTMGLLRNGCDYYLFAKDGDNLVAYKHVNYTDIAADEPTYAWLGGWKTAVEAKNFISKTGAEVDALFETPTELNVNKDNAILFVNDTYQINVSTDKVVLDNTKFTYVSSNEDIATVSPTGLVTAKDVEGECDITVSYGELTKTVHIRVTADADFNVVLDGKFEDNIWTDLVKSRKYTLVAEEGTDYIDFVAAKNNKGIYLMADYYASTVKSNNPNDWWENDNFEFLIGNKANLSASGQKWVSTKGSGETCATEGFVKPLEEVEGGKYFQRFEIFVSYADANVSETDDITFRVGYNGAKGWRSCAWWESGNFDEYLKITEEGFVSTVKEYIETPVTNELKTTSGGWTDRANWSDLATDVEGDFTLVSRYDFDGNLGEGWLIWKHPILVISDANQKDADHAYGDNATFRLDWCAWQDDRAGTPDHLAEEIVAGENFTGGDHNENMPQFINGSEVVLTIRRTGNDLSIKYDLKSKSTGVEMTFDQQALHGLRSDKLDISLSAEFSKFTISSSKLYK